MQSHGQVQPCRRNGRGSLIVVLLGVVLAAGGCSTFSGLPWGSGPEDMQGIVALYPLVDPRTPSTGRLFRRVPDERGGTVRVRAFPIIWSASFYTARAVEQDGERRLDAFLDPHGRMLWQQARTARPVERVAVVVDGVFRFFLRLTPGETRWDRVSIPGPWRADELRRVARRATDNYRAINRKGARRGAFLE